MSQPFTHDMYLKQKLNAAKTKLRNIQTKHQVDIAVYNAEQHLVTNEIDSIERHLSRMDKSMDELHKEAIMEDHYKPIQDGKVPG